MSAVVDHIKMWHMRQQLEGIHMSYDNSQDATLANWLKKDSSGINFPPGFSAETIVNCWEMILLATIQPIVRNEIAQGFVDRKQDPKGRILDFGSLSSIYTTKKNKRNWIRFLTRNETNNNLPYKHHKDLPGFNPLETSLTRGDLIFVNGTAHVAMVAQDFKPPVNAKTIDRDKVKPKDIQWPTVCSFYGKKTYVPQETPVEVRSILPDLIKVFGDLEGYGFYEIIKNSEKIIGYSRYRWC